MEKEDGIVRAGATKNPHERGRNYVYDKDFNYSGTMFYAEVSNMKESESKLLKHKYRDNSQGKSNLTLKSDDDGSGFVYLIKEE